MERLKMSEEKLKEKIEKILEEEVKITAERIIEAIKEDKTDNPVWEKEGYKAKE